MIIAIIGIIEIIEIIVTEIIEIIHIIEKINGGVMYMRKLLNALQVGKYLLKHEIDTFFELYAIKSFDLHRIFFHRSLNNFLSSFEHLAIVVDYNTGDSWISDQV